MPTADEVRNGADDPKGRADRIDQYLILLRFQILAAIGGSLIFLYALRFWSCGDFLRIFSVGILVAAAALTAGFLVGFIFAIPRMGPEKQASDPSTTATEGEQVDPGGQESNPVTPNSNLVEISDWLTKIIVGLGLVELNKIPSALGSLSYYAGISMRPAQCPASGSCADFISSGQAAALTIMVFYFALGFLIGYIWTRLYFQRDLGRQLQKLQQDKKVTDSIMNAEAFMNEGKFDEALKEINKALKKNSRDGRAILTKGRILKRQAMEPGVSPEDSAKLLNQALDFANQAIALLPGKAEPIYNKACYQARLGMHTTEILSNLRAAFALNPGLRRTASEDRDLLDSLEQDADFRQLVGLPALPAA